MRLKGIAEELQRRRLRFVELVEGGKSPEDVAYLLCCGRSSVSTCVKTVSEGLGALTLRQRNRVEILLRVDAGETDAEIAEQMRRLCDEWYP